MTIAVGVCVMRDLAADTFVSVLWLVTSDVRLKQTENRDCLTFVIHTLGAYNSGVLLMDRLLLSRTNSHSVCNVDCSTECTLEPVQRSASDSTVR